MGSIDILRDRERGVPRYCEFRRLFHLPAPKSFVELIGGNRELASQIRTVYNNDIENVDLMVGMFCEPLPKGFGFSDAAFKVFILIASRRIKSDRFLAGDGWSEEVYTKEGLAWVENETMGSVLVRHFPELRPALHGKDNAFRPWVKLELRMSIKVWRRMLECRPVWFTARAELLNSEVEVREDLYLWIPQFQPHCLPLRHQISVGEP
jgi:hypothetical protein